jgi:hypothetical protein
MQPCGERSLTITFRLWHKMNFFYSAIAQYAALFQNNIFILIIFVLFDSGGACGSAAILDQPIKGSRSLSERMLTITFRLWHKMYPMYSIFHDSPIFKFSKLIFSRH